MKAIIVEDEPLSLAFLQNMLGAYWPEIEIVGTTGLEQEAITIIQTQLPDLVFLDIELQQGTGFSVLQHTRNIDYNVIFTTALDYIGITALQFSGVPYIQKPIDMDALRNALDTMDAEGYLSSSKTALAHLLQTLDNNNQPAHLLVATIEGPCYVTLKDIVYLENEHGGIAIQEAGRRISTVGKTLKEFEILLQNKGFFRPNADQIIQLNKALPGGIVDNKIRMMNLETIAVSSKKEAELNFLLFSQAAMD